MGRPRPSLGVGSMRKEPISQPIRLPQTRGGGAGGEVCPLPDAENLLPIRSANRKRDRSRLYRTFAAAYHRSCSPNIRQPIRR